MGAEVAALIALSTAIADSIGRRDVARLRTWLAPGFVHRSHGGAASGADGFLQAITNIPGEIRFVRVEQVAVDPSPAGALVTGIQHAQVAVDEQLIDDRRRFVDWFVKHDGEWRLQAAVDLPPDGDLT